MALDAILWAAAIFLLRIINNAVSTTRVVLITRDMRMWSVVLSFIEALTFIVVIANVLKDLSNLLNLIAYCGGYSVGGYVGLVIEARFLTSYVAATIITRTGGREIALALRQRGYGVTESIGEGRDGTVSMLRSVIFRRDVGDLLRIVRDLQPEAFVSVEETHTMERGWLRQLRNASLGL